MTDKVAPRWPQNGSKLALKWLQDGPKMAQDGPQMAQEGSQMAPEREGWGERTVRDKRAKLEEGVYYASASKCGKTQALGMWGSDWHKAFFPMTLVTRLLYGLRPDLRQAGTQGFNIKICGRWAQRHRLFQPYFRFCFLANLMSNRVFQRSLIFFWAG